MKKIIKNSLIILVLLILITGCGKKNIKIVNMGNTTSSRNNNPAYNINVYGSGTLNCTRDASAYSGLNATFNYGVVYKNGIINEIHSIEKVKGNDTKALDEYEDAYNDIKKRYKNLDYYTITVTRSDDSVIYDSVIEYDKINMDKLIKIEGNKNKVYNSNNELELDTWYKFAKKMGTTCRGI